MCMYASDAKPEFSSSFQTANKSNRSYSQHYVAFHLHSLASSRVDMLRFTFANINWPKYVWFVFYLQFSRRSFADIDQIVVLLLFPVVRLHVIMSGANAFLSIRHWFVPFGQVALTPFNTSPQRHKLNILGVHSVVSSRQPYNRRGFKINFFSSLSLANSPQHMHKFSSFFFKSNSREV